MGAGAETSGAVVASAGDMAQPYGGHPAVPLVVWARPKRGAEVLGLHVSWWVAKSGFSRCWHSGGPHWPLVSQDQPTPAVPTDVVIGSRGVQEGLRPLLAVGPEGPLWYIQPRDAAGERRGQ